MKLDGFRKDQGLSEEEFCADLRQCFDHVSRDKLSSVFGKFDLDGDGILNKAEVWNLRQNWIVPLMKLNATTALVIVDFQNDFISGNLSIRNGPAKQDPESAIPPINHLVKTLGDTFKTIIYTLDWHPENHISFVENVYQRKLSVESQNSELKVFETVKFEEPCVEQVLWPNHCVQGTWGSQLHSDLYIHEKGVQLRKGTHPEIDSYSAFFDNHKISSTELDAELRKHSVTTVLVCGLAYDVCVGATAHDAIELGYNTAIIQDCSIGLDRNNMQKVQENVKQHGGAILDSSDVRLFMAGENIPWAWAQKLL